MPHCSQWAWSLHCRHRILCRSYRDYSVILYWSVSPITCACGRAGSHTRTKIIDRAQSTSEREITRRAFVRRRAQARSDWSSSRRRCRTEHGRSMPAIGPYRIGGGDELASWRRRHQLLRDDGPPVPSQRLSCGPRADGTAHGRSFERPTSLRRDLGARPARRFRKGPALSGTSNSSSEAPPARRRR